jgi:flavin-dependent dehydrogenase
MSFSRDESCENEPIRGIRPHYDVVVAGGGLAGLCLALQLKQAMPTIEVLVAEKSEHPLPEAAHKVGESSVEVGSHYFKEILGLADVLAAELPKFGLRFFLSHDGNRDISTRLECGPSHFLYVPSYQIDRGHFENELAGRARAAGIDVVDGCHVKSVALGPGTNDHVIGLARASERSEVSCQWLADATGRAALLRKKLQLTRSNRHDVNAVWFRIDHPIDVDNWSEDPGWHTRVEHSRRLSTNHLMGSGYWVWLIPLANDRTSVGIVSEEKLHPFSELRTFEMALAWLEKHEPQCAAIIRAHAGEKMDFLALKNYSYDVEQVYSKDRWCLVGEAGVFIDPFYSPGSDFIGIGNGFASALITKQLQGEEIDAVAEAYDQAFRSLARTCMVTYYRQYPLMGNARVMTSKIVWDFVMYWGGVAPIFFRNKLTDPAFMNGVRPVLQAFAYANVEMQAFFREWASREAEAEPAAGSFVDYAEMDFLAELNRSLQVECDDVSLLEQLNRNLRLAMELKDEIVAHSSGSGAPRQQNGDRPATEHLHEMFAVLGPAKPASAPDPVATEPIAP